MNTGSKQRNLFSNTQALRHAKANQISAVTQIMKSESPVYELTQEMLADIYEYFSANHVAIQHNFGEEFPYMMGRVLTELYNAKRPLIPYEIEKLWEAAAGAKGNVIEEFAKLLLSTRGLK